MIDSRELRIVENRLGAMRRKAPGIMAQAINRATVTFNKVISKETRKEYHIKARDIKKTITVTKASRYSLGAVIESKGGRESIRVFKASPTRQTTRRSTVKVAVKRDGTKQLLHAFVVDRLGSHIFERVSGPRLPIRKIRGPAVPQMLKNRETVKLANKEAMKTFKKRIDHGVDRALGGH